MFCGPNDAIKAPVCFKNCRKEYSSEVKGSCKGRGHFFMVNISSSNNVTFSSFKRKSKFIEHLGIRTS